MQIEQRFAIAQPDFVCGHTWLHTIWLLHNHCIFWCIKSVAWVDVQYTASALRPFACEHLLCCIMAGCDRFLRLACPVCLPKAFNSELFSMPCIGPWGTGKQAKYAMDIYPDAFPCRLVCCAGAELSMRLDTLQMAKKLQELC